MRGLVEDFVEKDLSVVLVLVVNRIVRGSLFHAILKIKVNLRMRYQQVNSLDRAFFTCHHQDTLLVFTLIDSYF
jgi:hypothetical protein